MNSSNTPETPNAPVTITAPNKELLNGLIDNKIREGYLLKGGMQNGEQGDFVQIMVRPENIDSELTAAGAIKLVFVLSIYIAILYFFL